MEGRQRCEGHKELPGSGRRGKKSKLVNVIKAPNILVAMAVARPKLTLHGKKN